MPEIKTEAKPVPDKGAGPAAKAPLFSGMGMMVLVAACAVCAGAPTAYFMMSRGGDAPKSKEGEPAKPHADAPPGELPPIPNTVALDPIKMPYRDAGTGAPKRYLNVTVILAIKTLVNVPEGGGEGGPSLTKEQKKCKEKDDELKAAVEKRKPWIYNKIYEILRGKGPEDFATNELVEQVQQQIKRSINDELFEKQSVVESVLFTDQNF